MELGTSSAGRQGVGPPDGEGPELGASPPRASGGRTGFWFVTLEH